MPSRLTAVLVSLLLATPALIFYLWLVFVPARVAILCPEGCDCDRAGYNIYCSWQSLTAVPLIHLTDVRVLRLSYNEITVFEKDSFVSLTELQLLDVNKCGLRKIELGAFNGLTKLTELLIAINYISELIPGTFKYMNSLEHIDLSENNLQYLSTGVFSGLLNLNYIDFAQNNLKYIHPDTFLGSPNLQILNLDINIFLQIPTDRNFINSKSLSNLHIQLCNISSLSVETFANVSALEWLDLGFNNLRTLDINILRALPKLSKFFLQQNPLRCDCQLQEVWRWCKDRKIYTGSEGDAPHCHKPRKVKKSCWDVLENGQCIEGNIQYYGDYKNKTCSYKNEKHSDFYYDFERIFNGGFLKNYQIPLYVFPFIFGTTGNIILLIIIICNTDTRTLPNMYILHLAISDIIYLTVLFSEACVSRNPFSWSGPDFTCVYFTFFRRLSVGLSAYSVALYSIQRYRVTVNPFHVRVSSAPKWRNIVATFCGLWIAAALFAVPSTISRNNCLAYVAATLAYYQRVVIFELLVSCVLPLCVIAFTYTMTARHLAESSRPISEGTQNPQHKTRKNTAKVVVGLTVVFVISYVPYHVFWTYFICSRKDTFLIFKSNSLNTSHYELQYTYLISNCFLLINPCLNPVALFFTSSLLRQHLKRYLTRF